LPRRPMKTIVREGGKTSWSLIAFHFRWPGGGFFFSDHGAKIRSSMSWSGGGRCGARARRIVGLILAGEEGKGEEKTLPSAAVDVCFGVFVSGGGAIIPHKNAGSK